MGALTQDTVLGERYRLTTRIAVGGMGEVWRAQDALLHRPVAVKVLKTDLSADPAFLDRFRNEARSAAAFSHAGIAGVYDYGETGAADATADAPTAYLVMELVEGEPLAAIIAREGRLAVGRTLDYVGQAAAALQVAHRNGLVHRDIKPGNLLIGADGRVKITDFGIARVFASTARHTQAGMVVGTAQYFSPEQAEGRVVGPPSDVYSLGVVAYECLAGRLPFTADSPVTVAVMQIRNVPPPLPPDVPPPVRAVVERAMAKDARWRYPTGGALAQAVAAAAAGRFDPTPPAPAGPAPAGPLLSGPVHSGPIPSGPIRTGPGPAAWPPSGSVPTGPSRAGRWWATGGVLVVLAAVAALLIWLLALRHHDDGGRDNGRPLLRSTPSPAEHVPRSAPGWSGQDAHLLHELRANR